MGDLEGFWGISSNHKKGVHLGQRGIWNWSILFPTLWFTHVCFILGAVFPNSWKQGCKQHLCLLSSGLALVCPTWVQMATTRAKESAQLRWFLTKLHESVLSYEGGVVAEGRKGAGQWQADAHCIVLLMNRAVNLKRHMAYLHSRICSSTTYRCQKGETTQMPISRWMDKLNGIYTHNGCYLASKRKEILTHATTWRNLEDIMWNKPVTKIQILYNSIYMWYLEQANPYRQKVE